MTNPTLVVIILSLFIALGLSNSKRWVKPPFKAQFYLFTIVLLLFGGIVGGMLGYLAGQKKVLELRMSYYSPEVVQVSGYDRRGVRTFLTDTVYKFNWNPKPLVVPYADPMSYYISKRDTLWAKAIFFYEAK